MQARFLLWLILLIAAFLRTYQITTVPPGLYQDEAMNGNDALENLETGRLQVFYPENGGREGLYINIVTPLVYTFGNSAWVLRLPAAIFGILTVWGVYLLAAELFSIPIGLLAAFFLAASFWHINFSRIGLRAIGSPLFLAWALYLLLDAIGRLRQGGSYLPRTILAGIVYGLGFYTYIVYRATPALVCLILWFHFRDARKQKWLGDFRRSAAAFTLAALLTTAPLAFYFLRHPGSFFGRASEVSIFQTSSPIAEFLGNLWKLTQMIFVRGDFNWRHNIAWRPVVFWPVAILFAVGVALSLHAIFQRRPAGPWTSYMVALAWLMIAALPAALSSEGMPHALRSLLMAPAIFILAAAGAVWAYDQFSRRLPARALRAASAAVLLALCYEAYHSYFAVWAPNANVAEAFNRNGAEIAARINSLPPATPKHVIVVETGAAGGMPAPAQTVMFLTGSYTRMQQERTAIHYITRQSTAEPDGVEFCRTAAAKLSEGEAFCLQVNRLPPPVF